MTARRGLGGLLAALGVLLAPAAGAQLRDAGTFGATCPAPPPVGPPTAGRLRLPPAGAPRPSPDGPGLPVAATVTRRVLAVPGGWPAGAPPAIALLGADAASLAVARALPAGAAVYVVPPARPALLAALRAACPGCVVGPAGPGLARALGIRAVPAVVRRTGDTAELVEGAP